MSFGVIPAGFGQKTIDDILAEIEAAHRAAFGAGVNQSATSVLGQLNGTFALPIAELWEVAAAVYRATDPNAASGEALDALCQLTGVTRLAASKSTVTLTVNLDADVNFPAGRVVSATGNPGTRFVTTQDIASTGAGNYQVAAEAETAGPTTAVAGSLTVIETPLTGWNSVTNAADAVPGRNQETDAELRARRVALLRATGAATYDAIRADLLDVDGVTEAVIFENETNTTDGNGVPARAFECIVRGGTDADIAAAIWGSKPVGVATHGSVTQNTPDSQGTQHAVKFSRPTVIDIYISLTVVRDTSKFPGDGEDQIKAALVALGETLKIGDDVVRAALFGPVFDVLGVVDVTALTLGTAPSPAGTANIVIAARELADFDTSRIVVTLT